MGLRQVEDASHRTGKTLRETNDGEGRREVATCLLINKTRVASCVTTSRVLEKCCSKFRRPLDALEPLNDDRNDVVSNEPAVQEKDYEYVRKPEHEKDSEN
jgi:hypothetical protein